MKYNFIKNRLAFIFIAGLILFGCSDTEGQRLVEQYGNVDTHDYSALKSKGDALLKHLIEREKLDEMEPDCEGGLRRFCTTSEAKKEWLGLVKQALLLGIEKQDIPLVGQIANRFELNKLKLTDEQSKSFSQFINKNLNAFESDNEALASVYSYIGEIEVKKKNYYEAYELFTKAVIVSERNKSYFSESVKSMLRHFGCKQDLMAWDEIPSTPNYVMSGSGASYDALPVDDGFDIGIARKALINLSEVPELQKKCPINLYKE
ncbi:TPA: hypothetical protein RQN23_000744 [Aeromonas veronii]|nr:hypothetical protein [Aeromonas veronii]